MSGRPLEQRDQAVPEPPRAPLDFAQAGARYTTRVRRRRNRRYGIVAALIILAAGLGAGVVLLADWLGTFRN